MSTTMATQAPVPPVVGTFDDVGRAEHAVHDLHAAAFRRDEVSMEWEEVEVPMSAPPAPRSYATSFAFVSALLGGAIPALLAAHVAPRTLTLYGFNWQVSPVVILALVGGTMGWVLGAILGLGHIGREDDIDVPEAVSLQEPVVTVSVLAPSRPEEARAILHQAGARAIQGGDRTHTAATTARPATVHRQRSGGVATATRVAPAQAQRQAARVAAPSPRRAAPSTPPGRHARLPLGARDIQAHPRRTGVALVVAVVAGGLFALLRRRRD